MSACRPQDESTGSFGRFWLQHIGCACCFEFENTFLGKGDETKSTILGPLSSRIAKEFMWNTEKPPVWEGRSMNNLPTLPLASS